MSPAQRKRILYKLAAALCVIVAVAGGFGVKTLNITQRGIAIGVSLDLDGGRYRVGVQFVEAGEANAPGSASLYEVVEGKGNTLTEAMDDVAAKSSQHPSYAHCKVLFVGESLLNERLDNVMQTLLHNHRLGNVQVVAVQGTGFDSLSAHVPISETAGAYMEKENRLVNELGGRMLVSIKDYCQRIGPSGTKYLPYAIRIPAQSPLGKQDGDDARAELFDVYNTVAADSDDVMHVYGHRVTQGVGLIEGKSGRITAYRDDDAYVSVYIRSISIRRRYARGTVKGRYDYDVEVLEQTLCEGEPTAAEIEGLVRTAIDEAIDYAYRTCLADDVDIFSLCGRLYKRYGEVYPLQEVTWQREIGVKCR